MQYGNIKDVKPARTMMDDADIARTMDEGNIGDIARVMPYNTNRNIIHYYYRINRGCNVYGEYCKCRTSIPGKPSASRFN